MADMMDLVQQRVEEERQHRLQLALIRRPLAPRATCITCDMPIPAARQQAVPGVQCCVSCQEITELKRRHYCPRA